MRKLFACLSFLLLPFFSFSQKSIFKGGYTIGLTTAQVHGDGYAGFNKTGFTGGFLLKSKLSEKISFQGELTYITKGSFDPPNFNIGKFTQRKIKLHYIELPLFVKFRVKKFNFNVGASVGFLTLQKQYDQNGLLPVPFVGPFKKTEIAYLFGADFNLSNKWAICWRNSLSLLPVSNQLVFDRFFLGFFGGAYNQCMSITIQHTFNGKSE